MQKKYLYTGAILVILSLSYLFYRSCKRDTIVIAPAERLALPDSAWLSGSINMQQIRKELAWSALLNGDIFRIFQADTSSGILIQIIKRPDDFLILEQNNIPYFSVWKDTIRYSGIIFRIENSTALQKAVHTDSTTINQKTVYSFRTKEGFWMCNAHNLLFIGQAENDSIFAATMFRNTSAAGTETTAGEIVLLNASINTAYIPDSSLHPLLKHAAMYVQLKNNSKALQLDWKYTGAAAALFMQGALPVAPDSTGMFFTCIPSADSIQAFLQQLPQLQAFYTAKKNTFAETLFATLDRNTVSCMFNGWRKVKNSYYASVMNEEFEMVLQKKDTSFIEPVFRIQVTQGKKASALGFISYLQKEGLISRAANSSFDVIPGNFDSVLRLEKDQSLVLQNKHHKNTGAHTTDSITGACSLRIQPQFITGLFDSKIKKDGVFAIDSALKKISLLELLASKDTNTLSGSLTITFNTDQHPVIACIQVLKK